jgi:hypothetical protein
MNTLRVRGLLVSALTILVLCREARAQGSAAEPAADAGNVPNPPPNADNIGNEEDEGGASPTSPPPRRAAAAPAARAPEAEPAAAPERPRDIEGVSLAPGMPDFGGEVTDGVQGAEAGLAGSNGYHFDFHGYVRAPMRVGSGPKNDGTPGTELHSPPRSADLSFTDWNYTNNLPGPWTELLLSYGNARASVTASIASYNQTVAGYRDLQAQLGINQAFVTLTFPDAFGRFGGLRGVFGSFTNRYGGSGKYGGGMYDTYLFGRTRAVGETLTADLNLSRSLTLIVEHGVGAKLDVTPFDTLSPRPAYVPYPGPVPQGSTFVHHAHLALDIDRTVSIGTHYITVWTPDDHNAVGTKSQPGRMSIYGAELRLTGTPFGEGFVGYSRVHASHILPIADAIEVLHSLGGSSFKNNFFGGFDPVTRTKLPDDSGDVDSVLFQYTLSSGKIARYPKKFGGNGADLLVTPFAMWNHVKSTNNDNSRLKYGADVLYSPLPVIAFGGRYDLVQPELKDSKQSFSVVSPKIILRTSFVAHEAITVQYSHYFLGSKVRPGFPYGDLPNPDPNVFMISASMWW